MPGKKMFFNDNTADTSFLYWDLDDYDAELGFKISNTSVILHSQTPKSDKRLSDFVSKLTLLSEEIDLFLTNALGDKPSKKKAIRKWLNSNIGDSAEFSGSVCHYYSKNECYLEISSCDRAHRFYITPGKDNKPCNRRTIPQLTLLKTMIGQCIQAVELELKNTSKK